jgi:hypothetical protein
MVVFTLDYSLLRDFQYQEPRLLVLWAAEVSIPEMPEISIPGFLLSKDVSRLATLELSMSSILNLCLRDSRNAESQYPDVRCDHKPTLLCRISRLRGFHPQEPGYLVSRTSEIPNLVMPKCRLPIVSLQCFGVSHSRTSRFPMALITGPSNSRCPTSQ